MIRYFTFFILFVVLLGAEKAHAEFITVVNDGTDDDLPAVQASVGLALVISPANITTINSAPAPEFAVPGFFGGTLGSTDVGTPNNSVAHRFFLNTMSSTGTPYAITDLVLTIRVNELLAGSSNDRLLIGFANDGPTAGSALTTIGLIPNLLGGGDTITINLLASGFAAAIQQNGFFDVLITDDTNVDFIALSGIVTPIPAALPLMASALLGGSLLLRRRHRKVSV